MVLQSQARLPAARTAHMYRRSHRNKFIPAIIAIGILSLTGWGLMKLWPSGSNDPETEIAALNSDGNSNQTSEDRAGDAQPQTPKPMKATVVAKKDRQLPNPISKQTQSRPNRSKPIINIEAAQAVLGKDVSGASSTQLSDGDPTRARDRIDDGKQHQATNQPLRARLSLSRALASGTLDLFQADRTRQELQAINNRLVFSREVVEGDPFVKTHVVKPGERLGSIVKSEGLLTDWRFILRINRIRDDTSVRAGQKLKLITGPFHVVIDKSDFRMDLYLGQGAQRVYITSFPVGLGENNSTPTGLFRVRTNSKLVNPEWTNPWTRQRFTADNPANPIGERWIGLEGVEDHNRDFQGYGIHGTIDMDSIGKQSSMGCIRMGPEDVNLIYEVLVERASTIEIRP
ncbi:MAG: L,D-transpeptidase family protein [Planctomycetes bacterium]|nr:L,D-transpeptidase family protein [Planctomycetota bacterium]